MIQKHQWPELPPSGFIRGRLATASDVRHGDAVFFIKGDAVPVFEVQIPQYAKFSDGSGAPACACILLQAEKTIDGVMVGLRSLDGQNIIAVLSDVEMLGQLRPAQ